MLHAPTIWHSVLEGLLSFCGRVDQQGTGSWYQEWLLRGMKVSVKGPVSIGPGTSFLLPSNLILGRYVSIGAASRIAAWAPIEIGDDFLASDRLNLNSGTHDAVTLRPGSRSITIGRRVWCGTGVTICAGVEIGDDVVIGAGAVVTRSLPSNSIAYGVPARAHRSLGRTGERVWSLWPERAEGSHIEHAPEWKKRLHYYKARL